MGMWNYASITIGVHRVTAVAGCIGAFERIDLLSLPVEIRVTCDDGGGVAVRDRARRMIRRVPLRSRRKKLGRAGRPGWPPASDRDSGHPGRHRISQGVLGGTPLLPKADAPGDVLAPKRHRRGGGCSFRSAVLISSSESN